MYKLIHLTGTAETNTLQINCTPIKINLENKFHDEKANISY